MLVIQILVPATISLILLSLAAVVAVRNRSIFRPRLRLSFRLHAVGKEAPKVARRSPAAIFLAGPNKNSALTSGRFPIAVKNQSRRRVGEVMVRLSYPAPYFVSNKEMRKLYDEACKFFPEHAEYDAAFEQILGSRKSQKMGEIVHVEYDFGAVRPGENKGFFEWVRLPERKLAFKDARYEDNLYGTILDLIEKIPEISGVCHIEAEVLSDLNKPSHAAMDLVLCEATEKDVAERIINPYVDAHWLNDRPKGRYYRPFIPVPSYRRPMVRSCAADIVIVQLNCDVTKVDDHYVALITDDPIKSEYALGMMNLPGYSYHNLPSSLTLPQALLSIGFAKPWRRNLGLEG